MIARKSFQFRLRPTKKQARLLDDHLNECRWLYNTLLKQRISAHEDLGMSLTKYDQSMFLPLLKEERPSLANVHSQVLQNVVDRLHKAFQGFFLRCKSSEKPGFPRFRGMHRYDSFCYPQSGFSLVKGELKLSKMGSIRIKMHRPIQGIIKTCTLKKTPSGEWDVSFSCEVETTPLQTNEESVGIDVGLTYFATFSNGEEVANPRFFRQSERKLAKSQQRLEKYAKGTKERRKQGKVVAKVHEKIRNQRKNFCHQLSHKIVNRFQYICVEDLNIKQMLKGSFLKKSIADVSWNQFLQFLSYKAAEAGRKLGLVNPAYTTQDCSRCGFRERKKLSDRHHHCSQCGYQASRDCNAAENILALGLDGLGICLRSSCL